MPDMSDFVVIVLCHKRPYDTTTPSTLRKFGYTGNIILLLDDEDDTYPLYVENFPDLLIERYSKDEYMQKYDAMDNFNNKKCAVYARNACFDVAVKNGYKYFCQMDDDYTTIPYRFMKDNKLYRSNDVVLDKVFDAYLDFLNVSDEINAVAFAEPGDFVGGCGSNLNKKSFLRKCMGSWICSVDKRFSFSGTMNDDVTTYSCYGARGKMFFTFNFIMIDTPATQSVKGGMTDIYLSVGTYTKTFYTVMACPSFVKVGIFGDRHYRIHHNFNWEAAVPKIVSSRYRRDS